MTILLKFVPKKEKTNYLRRTLESYNQSPSGCLFLNMYLLEELMMKGAHMF